MATSLAPAPPPPSLVPAQPPGDPALAAVGFDGQIGDFNSYLEKATQAHVQAFGAKPTPDKALDYVRARTPPAQITTPDHAAAQAAVASAQAARPHDFLTVRQDGRAEPGYGALILGAPAGVSGPIGIAQPQPQPETHPWLPQGFLPIGNFDQLPDALHVLSQLPGGTISGTTLEDYQKQATLALTTPFSPGAPDRRQALVLSRAVDTVKKAQADLKAMAPDFYGDLPVTGNFNADWGRATQAWTKSASYADISTKFMAKRNGFDNPGEFINAWTRREKLIASDPGDAQIYQHLPLYVFGGGKNFLEGLTGGTHGWGFANLPSVSLHTLGNLGKLAFGAVAGAWDQGKASAAALNEFLKTVAPHYLGGKGGSIDDANAAALAEVKKNPSWVRVFAPDAPDEVVNSIAGRLINLGADLVIGNRAIIAATGSYLAPGASLSAIKANRFFTGRVNLSYNSLAAKGIDGVGEASQMLQGGERFNAAVADAVKSGKMSYGEYRHAAAELFRTGRVTIGEETIAGEPILHVLRSRQLPTPFVTATKARQAIADHLDAFDASLRSSGFSGTTNAADMFSSLRSLVAHAAPENASRLIYQDRTAEDVYNWTVRNLGDRALANDWRNQFAVAKAREDIPRIQELRQEMEARYVERFPNKPGESAFQPSQGPQVESESYSYLHFPGGREAQIDGALSRLEVSAGRINDKLNRAGALHRQVIISGAPIPGGESLFYKHAIADTLRRFLGGGGLSFKLGPGLSQVRAQVQAHLVDNPGAISGLSTDRAAAEMGELRWITRNGQTDHQNFFTGDHFGSDAHMAGAGGYVRHTIAPDHSGDLMSAYRLSSPEDLGPLVKAVMNSSFHRAQMASSPVYKEEAAKLKASISESMSAPHGYAGTSAYADTRAVTDDALRKLNREFAQTQAEAVYKRLRAFERAGQEAGIEDPIAEATGILAKNFGAKVDEKLGEWIKGGRIAFDVRDGLINTGSKWDGLMQSWIGKLLTFNKLNRKAFYDHILYDSVKELTAAGMRMEDALPIASQLALRQTVYHMLDFSNMLQVEQNLRWLSYFATKHRLYWTWIAHQALTHPAQVGAIDDIRKNLDGKGNIPFELGGQRLDIPAARLVWANSTEYPQTSPIVETAFRTGRNIVQGEPLGQAFVNGFAEQTATSGNVFTRNDQAIAAWAKIATGVKSYGGATMGLTPAGLAAFNRRMHANILAYRASHGGAYPLEADVVKATMLQYAIEETHRANLFVPFLPHEGPTNAQQDLLKRFQALRSPATKRDFLDKNPQLADAFGVNSDQAQWLHEAPLWGEFNALTDAKNAALEKLDARAHASIYDAGIAKAASKIATDYNAAVYALKLKDANTWQGNAVYPKGSVVDGQIKVLGPWGTKLEGDPLAANAFLHDAYPGIRPEQLNSHTITERILFLEDELRRLRSNPVALGHDARSTRGRIAEINAQLEPLRAYPRTAFDKLQNEYYSRYVTPFRDQRKAQRAALDLLPTEQKQVALANLRAWIDEHDHPVVIEDEKGKAVKFESPVRMGWAMLPAAEYKTALAQAASNPWQDIAGYEKALLGVKVAPDVSSGWATLDRLTRSYRQENPGARLDKTQIARAVKAIERGSTAFGIKPHPGFYQDYLRSLQPRIRQFETTSVYRNLSSRAQFDELIGTLAKAGAALIADPKSGYRANEVKANWRNYIDALKGDATLPDKFRTQSFFGELNQPAYAGLKRELADFDPNFLYTLVG